MEMKVEMMEDPKMEENMGILMVIKMGDMKKQKIVEFFGQNQKIGFAVKIAKTGRNARVQKALMVVEKRAHVKVCFYKSVMLLFYIKFFGRDRRFYQALFLFLPAHYECQDKTCGHSCSKGICDGDGRCVSGEENPCAFHGCDGKSCGESCLSGDIMGTCDASGECNFNPEAIHCTGNAAVIDFNLFTLFIYDETFEHFITK